MDGDPWQQLAGVHQPTITSPRMQLQGGLFRLAWDADGDASISPPSCSCLLSNDALAPPGSSAKSWRVSVGVTAGNGCKA